MVTRRSSLRPLPPPSRPASGEGAREPFLGKYALVAELARGGMGIIHLAVAHGPGGFAKLFIVKELKPELARHPGCVSMFVEEARVAGRLAHPNIVQTIEVGQDGNRHFIVMEYLQGQPLIRIRKRRRGAFTRAAELRVVQEALRGLHYAHTLKADDGTDAGLIHRDMTPQNVVVTYDGQVKVVDFGIAKAADRLEQTQTGVLKGKAQYFAPEQLLGDPVDPRTDLFAVGVIMWEAVAQRRMWEHCSEAQIFDCLARGDIPSLRVARPDTPDALARIVEKATAWRPRDRHASAAQLAEEIDRYLARWESPPSLPAVGDTVARLFEEERERVRQLLVERPARVGRRVPRPLPRFAFDEEEAPTRDEHPARTPPRAALVTAFARSLRPRVKAKLAGALAAARQALQRCLTPRVATFCLAAVAIAAAPAALVLAPSRPGGERAVARARAHVQVPASALLSAARAERLEARPSSPPAPASPGRGGRVAPRGRSRAPAAREASAAAAVASASAPVVSAPVMPRVPLVGEVARAKLVE